MTLHSFADSLALSHSYADAPWWEQIYRGYFRDRFDGMRNQRDDGWAQRAGIDRQVFLTDGTVIKVDEKVRSRDYEDFFLERWSSVEHRTAGWLEKRLGCDFIAYAFVPSRRCYLLPYQQLKTAWDANKRAWWRCYGMRDVPNHGYTTQGIPVPIDVAMAALTNASLVTWSQT